MRDHVANLHYVGVSVTELPISGPDGPIDWSQEWRDENGHTIIDLDLVNERKGLRGPTEKYYCIRADTATYQYQDTDSTYYRYLSASVWLEEQPEILDRLYAALPKAWEIYCSARRDRCGDAMHTKIGRAHV